MHMHQCHCCDVVHSASSISPIAIPHINALVIAVTMLMPRQLHATMVSPSWSSHGLIVPGGTVVPQLSGGCGESNGEHGARRSTHVLDCLPLWLSAASPVMVAAAGNIFVASLSQGGHGSHHDHI